MFKHIPTRCLIAMALVALTASVYREVGGFSFIDYDDNLYLLDNGFIRKGLTLEGIGWAFSSGYASNWHPLTWISHMLDVSLFGMDSGMHHRVNLLIHLVNTLLVFNVLRRMTGAMWRSALVAALFGIHPLHVESVAWVAERKDLLCAFFSLLAIGSYERYRRDPAGIRYIAVFIFLAFALMSKPMAVTLPFLLILLDFWPLGRFSLERLRGSLAGKVPLVLLAAASSLVTFLVQKGGGSVKTLPLSGRLENAATSYVAYLGKTAWPSSMAPFYPHPLLVSGDGGTAAWKAAAAIVLLAGMTAFALREFSRRPWFGIGWFWFLGTMVPVIGLVQVGDQAFADRYTYIPLIGLFIACAWSLPDPARLTRTPRLVTHVAVVAALLLLALCARTQAGYWIDSGTLFGHALEVTESNWVAHDALGVASFDGGRYEESLSHFREALRIRPGYYEARLNLGKVYFALGLTDAAAFQIREAIRLNPRVEEELDVRLKALVTGGERPPG